MDVVSWVGLVASVGGARSSREEGGVVCHGGVSGA